MSDLNALAVGIISFFLGNVSGYFISYTVLKSKKSFDHYSRVNFLIIVVSLAWVVSLLVDILSPQYETSPLVHGIMGAIVGFFFWRPKDK